MVNEIEVKKTVIRKFTCHFPETARIKGIRLEVETTNDKISNVSMYGVHSSSLSLMELAFEYQDIFNKFIDAIRRELAPEIAERVLEEATKGGK